MDRVPIDLTAVVSDSDDYNASEVTLQEGQSQSHLLSELSQLSQFESQLGAHPRNPTSPHLPDRSPGQQEPSSMEEHSISIRAATPPMPAKGSASKHGNQDGKTASLPVRSSGSSRNGLDATPSSSQRHPPGSHRTPKIQTPKNLSGLSMTLW